MTNFTTLELAAFDLLLDGMCDFDRDYIIKMAIGKEKKDLAFQGNVNEIYIEDVAKHCGITINQAKGVIGSLSKKGYIWLDDEDDMICPLFEGVEAMIEDIREFKAA